MPRLAAHCSDTKSSEAPVSTSASTDCPAMIISAYMSPLARLLVLLTAPSSTEPNRAAWSDCGSSSEAIATSLVRFGQSRTRCGPSHKKQPVGWSSLFLKDLHFEVCPCRLGSNLPSFRPLPWLK
ncbi:uncharacterized protein LOC110429295 [Herrania umbratica]|uniref:Uncharacterized protein LOC110429295 n=1 Tax=Herrania umbratica TaxID=108875 RepID=A0A6J1BNA7_9ROSI|nr:uncharacterized protein LOC110429295 [Herrania umbratica]